ncbi:UPF0175 family protein [Microcystis aeruginosa]|jgi:predicted HTH domain antitoxin|uniref:Uncharacterized protein n=1 Tax=Microcystis aeruginosa FD4 TaxID=2686288 RepID=A0A857D5Z5_MICAE|nr:UPF0175 family protein [Microcystis aeruginosa]QGZ91067.1 hypothetical protein GQR42_17700 [Microcystis aeruginosa FD4]
MSIVISNEMIQATGKTENLLKLDLAIIMFKDYHISSAKAADFAGLSLIEFRQELAKRDVNAIAHVPSKHQLIIVIVVLFVLFRKQCP